MLMTSVCSSRNEVTVGGDVDFILRVDEVESSNGPFLKYVSMKFSWLFTLHEAQCEFSQEDYIYIVQSVVMSVITTSL